MGIEDRRLSQSSFFPALGSQPIDASKGLLVLQLKNKDGTSALTGVTAALDAGGAQAFYGQKAQSCNVGDCSANPSACPTGSRCESGVCLVGTSPECTTQASCPTGTLPGLVSGAVVCLAAPGDCYAPNPVCPALTYCQYGYSIASNLISETPPTCRPLGALEVDSVSGNAFWANLSPGDYTVTLTHATETFDPVHVRISADVEAGANVLAANPWW